MDVQDVLRQAREAVRADVVFGDPIDREGVTIVPAASVRGGGGGGRGEGPEGEGTGDGGGLALMARPAGAFVLRDGEVTWLPAVDVGRIVLGGQIVAGIVGLALVRRLARRRRFRRG